ncbi:hypothetical protein B0J15DRAFT_470243 [Fusarium solani]|uniref:Uncharacterized protein n=1 Tax=Fusarium solani TaxID=169388 RepID=A0A9P9GP77_FUSSL|nr:uncharacterized protein B0J15DRAFT_470243 [Fusarium solani]KAH7243199.1 hypothetical protein B0J15DRAFT_470243 [Fusarium solani]
MTRSNDGETEVRYDTANADSMQFCLVFRHGTVTLMAEDTEPQAPLARDRATETAIASERRAENPIPAAIELAHWRPPDPWSRPFTGEKAPSEPVASEVPVLDLSGPQTLMIVHRRTLPRIPTGGGRTSSAWLDVTSHGSPSAPGSALDGKTLTMVSSCLPRRQKALSTAWAQSLLLDQFLAQTHNLTINQLPYLDKSFLFNLMDPSRLTGAAAPRPQAAQLQGFILDSAGLHFPSLPVPRSLRHRCSATRSADPGPTPQRTKNLPHRHPDAA